LSNHLTLILPYILLAAGAVLAAVASNVIPEVERIGTFTGIMSGVAAGGLVMVGLKWLVVRFEHKEKSKNKLPVGLATAAAVDTFLDGAIISTGFSTGAQLGTLLAIALALELLFLTLSVGVEFRKGQFKPWQSPAELHFFCWLEHSVRASFLEMHRKPRWL